MTYKFTFQVENLSGKKNHLENIFMYLGNHVLRFENVEIDVEDEEKARKELRETPDVVKESLEAFKKLLNGLLLFLQRKNFIQKILKR